MEATISNYQFNTVRQIKAKADPVTDEQLLIEYRRTGNRELFAQLVYRYERELFHYLRRYMGNAEMAEDVFQATFLSVHLKCEYFEEGRRFRPWLYSVATNAAIDASRRNKRNKLLSLDTSGKNDDVDVGQLLDMLPGGEEDPAELFSRSERAQQVRSSLEQLPEPLMAVVQLIYYQGLKYREAAEVLDIPVGTVKSRVHAALQQLTGAWNASQVD